MRIISAHLYSAFIHPNFDMQQKEKILAKHKKIERKKELDRKRHRRMKRIKQRIREAKEAAKKNK